MLTSFFDSLVAYTIKFFAILSVALVSYIPRLEAQNTKLSEQQMADLLHRTEAHLTSFRNDSALAISTTLIKQLKASNQLDSPFGIKVRLFEALALEQKQVGEVAISKLLQVATLSKQKKMWDIYTKANLALALLNEKVSLKENSLNYLTEAKHSIDNFGLDSLYPYYAIRMSSWQRIFNSKDKALYYAKEALRTAPAYHLILEEAIGHMLMTILLPANDFSEKIYHSAKAIQLYKELDDYTGCSNMYNNVAMLYFKRSDYTNALIYNDSSLVAANIAINKGNDKHETIGYMYLLRGNIFNALGDADSARVNKEIGYKIIIQHFKENANAKIIKTESNYEAEQATAIQKATLKYKNMLLLVASIIVFLLLVILYMLYRNNQKQKSAKLKLAQQNHIIQQQTDKLKTIDETKTRFFVNVSHELRTPLTLMLGPVDTIIKENQLTKEQAELLQIAHNGGHELLNLVNQLLDLGKLDAGKLALNLSPTTLAIFFNMYLEQFESFANLKNINYLINNNLEKTIVALIDQEKFRQIAGNLLSNAFRFTEKGGSIQIDIQLIDDKLNLRFSDTGRGILPEDLPHIFTRYFQTIRNDNPTFGGTGIGLAICHEYTTLMGGTIVVNSIYGKGTTFELHFPIELVADSKPIDSSTNTTKKKVNQTNLPKKELITTKSLKKSTILVVEDNLTLQQYIRFILGGTYNLIFAENGKEALEKLGDLGGCDLILTDLMMPVMDGFQLLQQLKSAEETRSLPIIMLTARANSEDKLNALRVGVDDYLTKPFDETELKVRIEKLLENLAMRRKVALKNPQKANALLVSATDLTWLTRFEQFIQKHYKDYDFSISTIAYEFAMSESTLLRQLKRLTGLSPIQYIQEIRLDEARKLLLSGDQHTVSQIANLVGYKDVRNFSRSYKKRFGKLPSEYNL